MHCARAEGGVAGPSALRGLFGVRMEGEAGMCQFPCYHTLRASSRVEENRTGDPAGFSVLKCQFCTSSCADSIVVCGYYYFQCTVTVIKQIKSILSGKYNVNAYQRYYLTH